MLTLLLGRAGKGKTETVRKSIAERARSGARSMLLVPEQFSAASERRLYEQLGDAASAYAEVVTFKKLCADIFKTLGGGAKTRLDEPAKCALVRRALAECGGELELYGPRRRDVAFCGLVLAALNEFRAAGALPQDVLRLSETEKGRFGKKLREIGLIYSSYEALKSRGFADDNDRCEDAAERLRLSDIYGDTELYIDGFTDFTASEERLLAALMQNCAGVTAALCCESTVVSDGLFDACARTALHLSRMEAGRTVIARCGGSRFECAGPECAERVLAGESFEGEADGLYVYECEDMERELETAAAEICRLVREEGYRRREINVVVRSCRANRAAIERVFTNYGIPFECDAHDTLDMTGEVRMMLSALALCGRLEAEELLSMLKTGVSSLAHDDIYEFENYVYVWSADGDELRSAFGKNPSGFSEELNAREAEKLAAAERVRAAAVGWIDTLEQDIKNRSVSEGLYRLLVNSGALKAAEEDRTRARVFELCVGLLEEMHAVWRGEDVTAAEYAQGLEAAATAVSVSEAPSSLDCVAVGSADLMRADGPRAVFLLGANTDRFPLSGEKGGILTGAERDRLMLGGIELDGVVDRRILAEEFFFYRAACSASEKLYVSCSKYSDSGETLAPSDEYTVLSEHSCGEPPVLSLPAPFAVNERTTLSALSRRYSKRDAEAAAQREFLERRGWSERVRSLRLGSERREKSLENPAAIAAALGERLYLSASKIETFYQCPFSYFMNYAVGARELKKAELSPLETGTYVHYLLENIVSRGDFATLEPAQLRRQIDEKTDLYVEQRMQSSLGARERFILSRLCGGANSLLRHLQGEMTSCRFVPDAYELQLGGDGIPPVKLETADKKELYVTGKIDRVDLLRSEKGDFVRVIDYKTGTKDFELGKVYYGLNMQMLIYLFALGESGPYKNARPAGVLYQPCDPHPKPDESRAKKQEPYRPSGVMLDAPEVRAAFSEGEEYIPLGQNAFIDADRMESLRATVKTRLVEMGERLYRGKIAAEPTQEACEYCPYGACCAREESDPVRKTDKTEGKNLMLGGEK